MSRRSVRQTRRTDDFSSFVPTQLAGCVLWLRSDLGITLNGSTVSAWADQSGLGNNVTQGVQAQQPTYNSSDASYGNRPSLSFSQAATQFLRSSVALSAASQPITFTVVGEGSQAVAAQFFISVGTGAGQSLAFEDPGTSAPTELGMYAGSFSFLVAADSAAAFAVVFNGASSAIYRNNSQSSAGTGNPSTNGIPSGNNFFIGANGAASQSLQGKILEVTVHTRDLSADGSLTQLFRYYGSEYRLPTS